MDQSSSSTMIRQDAAMMAGSCISHIFPFSYLEEPMIPPASAKKYALVTRREWEPKLTIKCRFCGGPTCRRCSRQAALAKKDSPIKGLHADWVTDNILGMMRPSSKLMVEFDILGQFQARGIGAIINTTMPGEHPYCGYGLESSGFPYNPEDVMARGIHFYNFGWKDMTVPSVPYMLNIVKVMTSILQDGKTKIAVHCHAGYGRTGLAIACTLLFLHHLTPLEAVTLVRKNRPGSIQTSKQLKFVHDFYHYVQAQRLVFTMPGVHTRLCLEEATQMQHRMLHGHDASRYAFCPKIVGRLCHQMELGIVSSDRQALIRALVGKSLDENDDVEQTKVGLNHGHWHIPLTQAPQLLIQWLDQLASPLVTSNQVWFNTTTIMSESSKYSQRTLERILECLARLREALVGSSDDFPLIHVRFLSSMLQRRATSDELMRLDESLEDKCQSMSRSLKSKSSSNVIQLAPLVRPVGPEILRSRMRKITFD